MKHLTYLHNEHPQNPQDCSTATPGIPPPIRHLPLRPLSPLSHSYSASCKQSPFHQPLPFPAANEHTEAAAATEACGAESTAPRRRRTPGSGRPRRPQPGTPRPPRVHPTFLPDTGRRPRRPPALSPPPPPSFSVLQAPTHHPRVPSPALPAACARRLPGRPPAGRPAAPAGHTVVAALPPPRPRAAPSPPPPSRAQACQAERLPRGWRRGARSLTAGGGGSDLPTGPTRRARGRGENFCCGSSGDSSHPCAFLLFLPLLLLLLFLLLFLLPEQSRGRHGAARASPRSPPLPARCIMGSIAHRKRSGPPALAWRGDLAARPSVALILAPACQQRGVAGKAGPRSGGPPDGPERKTL
jgi:hypothetical protein